MNERATLNINPNGHLEIGGLDVSDIVKEYGTPLYVMDEQYIEDICSVLKNSLKSEYGEGLISYASKAFCCKEIYRIINKIGLGADVVSGGELFTALNSEFPAEKLIFHGNNKSYEELEYAISKGVKYIVIDALTEVDDIADICKNKGIRQDVLIRVNPGIEAHTHHYIQTSKIDSKFGFSLTDGSAEEIIKVISEKKELNLVGLHCHIGSQIFEKKSFGIAVEKMTDFYKTIKEKYGINFPVLNLGGGFGIYYANDDAKITVSDYADYIKIIAGKLKECVMKKGLEKPYLILEPGRSIVGEAGITLYKAGRIKQIKGVKNYIAVNGGMFDNPRFALYQAKYTVTAAEKMNAPIAYKYSIAGKCCESGDIIAEDCDLPEIKEGDILSVFSTGAYNYSMASNYNRNLIPPVIMVKNGKSRYAVKPQTFEDLIRNDI